jgi:F420-non-reducing hydrogenase small subunit
VVDVDYTVPGCPPESDRLWDVVGALVSGAPLPPKGSVLGAGNSTVCDQCRRTRSDKTVTTFKRTFEVAPDAQRCLVEQGLLCLGLATRDGCGALCPDVNMPCIGCYGPPAGVHDQGAKLAGAIGAVMDISGLHHLPEDEVARRVDAAVGAVPDYAGSFYKFSLSASLMQRHRRAAAATGGDDVTHHD